MRATEMVTFIQLQCEYQYDFATDIDGDYVLTNDHTDLVDSIVSAYAAFDDAEVGDDEDDGSEESIVKVGGIPRSYAALMFHLRAGHARCISVRDALALRGVLLLMNDGRLGVTIGTRGVIESAGEDLGLLLVREPTRYISAFLIPGVEYPAKIRRLPTVYPRWPTTTIEGNLEEEE